MREGGIEERERGGRRTNKMAQNTMIMPFSTPRHATGTRLLETRLHVVLSFVVRSCFSSSCPSRHAFFVCVPFGSGECLFQFFPSPFSPCFSFLHSNNKGQ